MHPTSRKSSMFASACQAVALLIPALLATGSLPASAADILWVGNDAFNNSNFSASGNWQNNTLPTWSSSNSLIFSQNQNANVTGLVYDLSGWQPVDDIKWAATFPVARTLSSSNGNGIDFRVRIENNSSSTQTVTLNTSGGKSAAPEIQLNPVKGSLILSGTIYNDNSVDYFVYGGDGVVTNLTLNTELGPNAPNKPNVDFTVAGGRTTAIQVNASQSWAGTTTVNSGIMTAANGVTLASTAFVLGGGTFATTSANTLADAATLTVNSGRLSVGGSDTVASLAGSGGSVDLASGATLTAGNAGSTSYAGSITGSGGFTKVGSGAMTLSGNNSYSGSALVSQGTLVGDASTSFGSGSIVLGDGNTGTSSIVLMANNSGNTTIANAITVANLGTGLVSIGGTNTGAGSVNVWNGTLTLNRNVQVFADTTPGSSGRTSFLGQITGSGGITVTQGRVTLQNGTNNFTGPVVVNSGATLQLDVGGGTNEVIPNSAAVTVNGALNFASGGGTETIGSLSGSGTVSSVVSGTYSLVVGGSTSTTFSGVITSGSGVIGLTKSGAGTLLLTGSNGFTGGAALNAGTLGVGSANALGSSGTISFGGGTLQYSASNTTDYSGRFSNAAGQQYSIDTNGQNVTLGSSLTSSSGSLTKLGAGTLTLSGGNTYGGGTTVSAGRLVGTTSTSLPGDIFNNAEVEFVTNGGSYSYSGNVSGTGTLIKSGGDELVLDGVNSYTGGTIVAAGTLFGTPDSLQGPIANSGVVAFAGSGTYAGVISGTGSLEVRGGDIAFTGTSAYTGATTVLGGSRMSVNGALGNTAVTVQAGGALGGSGSIFGPVVVDGQGTLSPGNSIASLAVGATTFTGTSEFLDGSTFEYEYDSSATLSVGADLLVVSGSLTIGAGSLITFADLAGSPTPFGDGTIFALINYSGAWNNGLFTYNGTALADGSRFFVGSQEWQIDYNRTSSTGLANYTGDYLPSSSFVAITAVPEPATWAMALAGLAAGGFMIRRPRSRS